VTEPAALADLARYASVELPTRPLLVPWVRPVEVGDGQLELRAAGTYYTLRHPLLAAAFRAVADRLAGTHDPESIAAGLPPGVEPPTVLFLLKVLRSLGLLLEGVDLEGAGAARERLLHFSHFSAEPAAIERRLATASVQVTGADPLAERVAALLRASGCERLERLAAAELEERGPATLLIACADAPSGERMAAVNVAALGAGQPWLRAVAHGTHAWLGPLVLPGESACIACLETRERANARGNGEMPQLPPGSIGAFAPQLELLAAQAAAEAVRFLGGLCPPATVGHVFELSATSPLAQRHALLRDPRCPACGGLWAAEAP
jgi:ribosomal protein S12 methylthiotransferase accessory factor